MKTVFLCLFACIFLFRVFLCPWAFAAEKPKLPPAESAIQDEVDRWGLAFSDQIKAFESHFLTFSQKTGIASP